LFFFIRIVKKVEANSTCYSAASETTATIIIANSQGKAIWANNAYLELTGLSLEEVIDNRPGTMSKAPETDTEATAKIRKAIKNKKVKLRF
jgi:PAS domain S-box-containing protein